MYYAALWFRSLPTSANFYIAGPATYFVSGATFNSSTISNYRWPACLAFLAAFCIVFEPQGQYWSSRTPRPNNGPPNMAAANFVLISNGEGCTLNGTAVAAVFIDQYCATFFSAICDLL